MRKAVLVLAALAGCSQTAQQRDDLVWMRVDGLRSSGNPELMREYQAAEAICIGRARQVDIAGPVAAPRPTPIAAGLSGSEQLSQSMADLGASIGHVGAVRRQRAGLQDVFEGCMGERGYVLVPRPAE